MRKLSYFLLPLAMVSAFGLLACSDEKGVAGGPGSITTNGIVAHVDGVIAPNARVALRKVDHMAASAQVENSIVVADAYTDSMGRFNLDVPEKGDFRLTVVHNGAAFTKIVSAESYASLDSVSLVATAVMKGETDIPDGSAIVWVGVLGTDILVPSDANGVFVLPALPANDSLQLYFVSEDYEKVLSREQVYFTPTEFAYESYKEPVVAPVDSTKEEPVDSLETPVDTLKKIVILQEDGTPAANANLSIRAKNHMVESFTLQNDLVKADMVAGADGKIAVALPDSGEYRLTATLGVSSISKVYDAASLSKIDTLKLDASSAISSQVTLDSGEEFAWVGVYGLDVLVKTNEIGAYVLPALPAGDSLTIYFVHEKDSVPFVEWSIRAPKEGFVSKNPVKLLYDFEEDDPNWYMSVDTLYKGSTFKFENGKVDGTHLLADHLLMDKDRGSKVFYARYEIGLDPYAWVLVGTGMDKVRNFSAVDSIEFYAKGIKAGTTKSFGKVKVSLENWESYTKKDKAASDWIELTGDWKKYVVKPSELCVNADEVWSCTKAWNSVKDHVKQLHFFPSGGNEIFIDDVKIYGVLY